MHPRRGARPRRKQRSGRSRLNLAGYLDQPGTSCCGSSFLARSPSLSAVKDWESVRRSLLRVRLSLLLLNIRDQGNHVKRVVWLRQTYFSTSQLTLGSPGAAAEWGQSLLLKRARSKRSCTSASAPTSPGPNHECCYLSAQVSEKMHERQILECTNRQVSSSWERLTRVY